MQILAILAPIIILYAVSLAKQKKYKLHKRVQNSLFAICLSGVLILEIQIRLSGGSGSLVKDSPYIHTSFFKWILTAHIIGAIITYLFWTTSIIVSNLNYKKKLPGSFTKNHKKLGYFIFFGLVFNAVSSLIVVTMAYVL